MQYMNAREDSDDDVESLGDLDEEIGWQPSVARPLLAREIAGLDKQRSAPPPDDDSHESSIDMAGPAGPNAVLRAPVLPTTITMTPDEGVEAMCARFSPDGSLLAVGCTDSGIRVYSSTTGKLMFEIRCTKGADGVASPVTSIRFRDAPSLETKNVVMFTTADGHLRYWHATSGKFLGTPVVEEDNQIFAMDVNVDGTRVATAGLDHSVRVYDTASRKLVSTLSGGKQEAGETSYGDGLGGHSNRVFALKYCMLEPHVLVSGGWDNTVQIWDVRVGSAVRSIYGPHLVGDALDIDDGVITTGSHRRYRAVQTWDMGSGQLIHDVPWLPAADTEPCMILSLQMGHSAKRGLMAAGGCGSREVRLLKSGPSGDVLGRVADLESPVHSLAFSPEEDRLAVICAHQIQIVDV
mmetsp:Transcript_1719/g.3464  ORF Transcript_1719/g.3464 Transcript_1719/m.3464 type:complete len:408 (-) Transcript_1719:37-1260(-)